VSLDFIQECKGILEKSEEVNGMKSHETNDRNAFLHSQWALYIRRGAEKSLAFRISYFPICSTTKRIFLGWIKEVRTTKS
jgi:hypothetical protein